MSQYANPSPILNTTTSGSFETMFSDTLNRNHSRRLQAYRTYWLFYLGKHWSYARGPGEPTITVNYCKRMVDLHVDFAFKKGFKVVIPDDPSTAQSETAEREFIRYMLEETWRKNNKELWLLEAGQQGSVTGDVFARVSWDKENPLEDPYSRVDIIPSHLCFPEFGGPHGVERKKLRRILIVIPVFREAPNSPISGAFFSRRTKNQEANELVIKSEEWTSPVYNKDGSLQHPAMVYRAENQVPVSEEVNPLGEIPIVHIPNYPLSGEYYGLSDMVDSVELNREYNEKMTDISDIINYHASPLTIVTGAKLKDMERGANRVWGLPENATAKNLEMAGDLIAANKHLEQLRNSIFELTGTPETVLGTKLNVSNTTGVALQIQYLPMLERRNVKILTYGLGLRLINRLLIKTTEIADSGFAAQMKTITKNRYRNEVVFPDPMPQDQARELQLIRERLDLSLSTRARELEGMGVSQAETKILLEEIDEEQQHMAENMFQEPVAGPGNRTLNRGGFSDTVGEKIDDDLLTK